MSKTKGLTKTLFLTKYKVVQLIKTSIVGVIPTLYDLPIQSYIIAQLVTIYPIIPIITKIKGLTKNLFSAKLFSS